MDAVQIIKAYRNKNQVEEAFKGIKSFIKFQPVNVRTDKHVKAHYTICILSYLLDRTITQKLRQHKIDGVDSVMKVYKELKRGLIGDIKLKPKTKIKRIVTPRLIEKKILKLFGCEHLTNKKHLRKMGAG